MTRGPVIALQAARSEIDRARGLRPDHHIAAIGISHSHIPCIIITSASPCGKKRFTRVGSYAKRCRCCLKRLGKSEESVPQGLRATAGNAPYRLYITALVPVSVVTGTVTYLHGPPSRRGSVQSPIESDTCICIRRRTREESPTQLEAPNRSTQLSVDFLSGACYVPARSLSRRECGHSLDGPRLAGQDWPCSGSSGNDGAREGSTYRVGRKRTPPM